MGVIVAPFSRRSFGIYKDTIVTARELDTNLEIPPPIASPHLIEYSVLAFRILVCFFWGKTHLIPKRRVANKFANTFNRILLPQMQDFLSLQPLLVKLISFYLEWLTFPLRSTWEAIYPFVERTLVLE